MCYVFAFRHFPKGDFPKVRLAISAAARIGKGTERCGLITLGKLPLVKLLI